MINSRSNRRNQALTFETKPITIEVSPMSQLFWRDFVRTYSPSLEIPQQSGTLRDFSRFTTEIFHRLYYDFSPQYKSAIAPEHEWAKRLHELLSENPEFEHMSDRTGGDAVAAGVGAIQVAKHLLNTLPQPEDEIEDLSELRDQVKQLRRQAALNPDPAVADHAQSEAETLVAQGKAQAAQAQDYATSIDIGAMDFALSQAASDIDDELEDLREQMELLGMPVSGGRSSIEKQVSLDQAIQIAEQLQNNPELRKILELAGKIFTLARTKRRQAKTQSGYGELVGVTTGNDLGRVLPSELSKLGHPQHRLLFFKDYVERSLLQYELQAPESEGRGPIIIMADNTGSMKGRRLIFSRALMVALSSLARQDKRDFCILHWSNYVLRTDYFEAQDQDCSDRLLQSIRFFGDGSNNEPEAFRGAVKIIRQSKTFKDADLIFLTDGGWGTGIRGDEVAVSRVWSEEFQKDRQELQLSVYALMVEVWEEEVQEYVQPDLMLQVSDLFDVNELQSIFCFLYRK